MKGKIIQISAAGHDNTIGTQCSASLFALTDEGDVWHMAGFGNDWEEVELPNGVATGRLSSAMRHVAANTVDGWARAYLTQRLDDFGLDSSLRDPVAARESPAEKAIDLAIQYGQIDGAHHKAWVIDQMVRALSGDLYKQVIADAKASEDDPDAYEWDEGIAP